MQIGTTVLYHANCPDGYAAAFACWQHFGDDAQYLHIWTLNGRDVNASRFAGHTR